jgi:hypothetical protein
MLRSRLLSTFTVIGAILIVLSIVGLIIGPRFVYDPGQPVTGKEAWYYLIIGILMVVNGLLTPAPPEEIPVSRAGSKSSTNRTLPRETAATSVEKSSE